MPNKSESFTERTRLVGGWGRRRTSGRTSRPFNGHCSRRDPPETVGEGRRSVCSGQPFIRTEAESIIQCRGRGEAQRHFHCREGPRGGAVGWRFPRGPSHTVPFNQVRPQCHSGGRWAKSVVSSVTGCSWTRWLDGGGLVLLAVVAGTLLGRLEGHVPHAR